MFNKINLTLFDLNPNTLSSLSLENQIYYDKALIRAATPKLVYNQFGQKRPIPKNNGTTVDFRRFSSLGKALTPLTEGVTPDGQSLNVTNVQSTVAQYGGYVTMSDLLELAAIDNNVQETVTLIGNQAGETLDTVTREKIMAGTNVQYGAETRTARTALVGGEASGNDYMTVDTIRRAVRTLRANNAPAMADGFYVIVVHPNVAYDLMCDSEWKNAQLYTDNVKKIYTGEVGCIAGARIVETTEAKVYTAEPLASDKDYLLIDNSSGYSGAITSVAFDGGTVEASALVGRKIMINGITATVTANTTSAITFASTNFGSIADNTPIYAAEAGAKGVQVFASLCFGKDAYGVTEITGGGLTTFIKQKGSAGTEDPLDQRSTVGWKATATAEILVPEYMVRVETTASAKANKN